MPRYIPNEVGRAHVRIAAFFLVRGLGSLASLSATTLYILPWHIKTEKTTTNMCASLCATHCFVHQVSVWVLQVIHQHGTPTHRRRCAFQPNHIVFHVEPGNVTIIIIISETRRDSTSIVISLTPRPTIFADWDGALGTYAANVWSLFQLILAGSFIKRVRARDVFSTSE